MSRGGDFDVRWWREGLEVVAVDRTLVLGGSRVVVVDGWGVGLQLLHLTRILS